MLIRQKITSKKERIKASFLLSLLKDLSPEVKRPILETPECTKYWIQDLQIYFQSLQWDEKISPERISLLSELIKLDKQILNHLMPTLLSRVSTILEQINQKENITPEDEELFSHYIKNTGLEGTPELNGHPSYYRFVQNLIIREFKEKGESNGFKIIDDLPIVLGKNEQIIWAYNDVTCWQEDTEEIFDAGILGSIKKRSDAYATISGATLRQPQQKESLRKIGTGTLFITTKNVTYCEFNRKAIRILSPASSLCLHLQMLSG